MLSGSRILGVRPVRSKKLLTALIAVAVAFLMSVGCVGCVVTGFDMSADLGTAAIWCGVAALLSGILFAWKLDVIPLCGTAAVGILLWLNSGMRLSFQAVIYQISRKYDAFYGWGVIRPLHYTAEMLAPETGLFLYFIGAVIAVLMTWAFSRRKMALPGMVSSLGCVASCFLVQGTVPDSVWLWMFLFGFLLLILTRTVRRADVDRGNRFAVTVAVPLAIFLLLLFVFVPQKNYSADKPAKAVLNTVLENRVFQAVFGDLTRKPGTVISADTDLVRLDQAGPQYDTRDEIMQITTDFSGRIYLRSRGLDSYNGKTWYHSGESAQQDTAWPSYDRQETLGTLQITTRFAHSLIYMPYYVQDMEALNLDAELENKEKITEYSYTVAKTPNQSQLMALETQLPDEVVISTGDSGAWHTKLAKKITKDQTTVYGKAQAIADYVRSSADYDLQTKAMPQLSNDFVKWFLESSDTGYCVHFASATTVLLQAAGIPARYVNGYLVDVAAGETTIVYSSDAHAWVEYWLPGFGWTVLEATPDAPGENAGLISQQQTNANGWKVAALVAAAILLVALAAVLAQWRIRLWLRREKLHSGNLKQQALAYWREAVRFANCLEEAPVSGLLEIAERAKFSNHPLAEEDLEPFLVYLDSAKQRIRNHGFFRKLYYRFILALY